jgi:hypothetical protein
VKFGVIDAIELHAIANFEREILVLDIDNR